MPIRESTRWTVATKPLSHSISFPPKIGGSLGILILQLLLLLQINERSLFKKTSLCKRDQPTNQSKPTNQTNNRNKTRWWFQPIWKICSSNWIISPRIGVKINTVLKPPTRKQNPTKSMDVSENSGTPESSILIAFSIINHPFLGTPIFGNTHISPVSTLRIPSSASCNWSRKSCNCRICAGCKNAGFVWCRCPVSTSQKDRWRKTHQS